MGTAARRPRLVGGLVALLAVAGAVLALRLEPTTATGTLVERGSPTWQATEDLHRRFGDDAIYVLVREKVSDLVLTADLGRLLLLEGCLSGNRPDRGQGRRRRAGAVRAAGGDEAGPGRLRTGHVPQHRRRPDPGPVHRPDAAAHGAGQARGDGGAGARAAPRALARRGGPARPRREPAGLHPGAAGDRQARGAVRAQRGPEPRRHELHRARRLRLERRARHAQGALRLPVPQPRQRPRAGPPAARAVDRRPRPGARRRARRRRDAAVAPGQGALHRHGRARRPAGPHDVDLALAREPARGRAGRHGRRARPRVPRAAAARAARGRARGCGADLRGDLRGRAPR